MPLQQGDVPEIRFPHKVEDVAEHRDGTDQRVEGHVTRHPQERGAGCAESDRLDENPPGENCARCVTEPGNQSENGIETKPQAGAGNPYPGIQPIREFRNGGETRRRRFPLVCGAD